MKTSADLGQFFFNVFPSTMLIKLRIKVVEIVKLSAHWSAQHWDVWGSIPAAKSNFLHFIWTSEIVFKSWIKGESDKKLVTLKWDR